MGLPEYNCTRQSFEELFRHFSNDAIGIRVTIESTGNDQVDKFNIHRGSGYIRVTGVANDEGELDYAMITCGHINPWFWITEMKLFRIVNEKAMELGFTCIRK